VSEVQQTFCAVVHFLSVVRHRTDADLPRVPQETWRGLGELRVLRDVIDEPGGKFGDHGLGAAIVMTPGLRGSGVFVFVGEELEDRPQVFPTKIARTQKSLKT
jgi:hypothetical protein